MTGPPPLSAPAPRVAVLARDALVRSGLERLVERAGLPLASRSGADLALVDASMMGELSRLSIPAVVLADNARAPELLAAGAKAVLRRDIEPERLSAALIAVSAGLVVLDAGLARSALPESVPDAEQGEELSAREREVLVHLASGASNKRIADRLGISEHTAKFHVVSILAKLGAATRTEAVVLAARRGLLWL